MASLRFATVARDPVARLACTALVCLLAMATPVQAQPAVPFSPQAEVHIDSDATPVAPITGGKDVPFTVRVSCQAPDVPPLQPVVVGFTATGSGVASIVLDKSSVPLQFDTDDCIGGAVHTVHGNATIFFTKDAAAAESFSFRLTVHHEGAEIGDATWDETPSAYGKYRVTTSRSIFKVDPGDKVDIRYTFDGNTNADLEICPIEWEQRGWEVPLPSCTVLTPKGAEPVSLSFKAPDNGTGIQPFTLAFEATAQGAVEGPDLEKKERATVLVRVQGFPLSPEELPAPAPFAVCVALTLLAWACRRR